MAGEEKMRCKKQGDSVMTVDTARKQASARSVQDASFVEGCGIPCVPCQRMQVWGSGDWMPGIEATGGGPGEVVGGGPPWWQLVKLCESF